MTDHRPLTPQQDAFCLAYVYYGNAAHAAREAGYGPAGARQQGHRLLKPATIKIARWVRNG